MSFAISNERIRSEHGGVMQNVPLFSVLSWSNLQCSPSRATIRISITSGRISLSSICATVGRLIACWRRAKRGSVKKLSRGLMRIYHYKT